MAVILEQLTDDPIFLAQFQGDFGLQDVMKAYAFTESILANYPHQMVYGIHDIRETTITFPVIMDVIKERNLQVAGSHISEYLQVVYVGRSNMIDIVRDALMKYNKTIPVFDTMDAALKAINIGLLGKDA